MIRRELEKSPLERIKQVSKYTHKQYIRDLNL
jgi:hypothetical protein